MKLSQSNFDLWSPDYYLVRSYLIATVTESDSKSGFLIGPTVAELWKKSSADWSCDKPDTLQVF